MSNKLMKQIIAFVCSLALFLPVGNGIDAESAYMTDSSSLKLVENDRVVRKSDFLKKPIWPPLAAFTAPPSSINHIKVLLTYSQAISKLQANEQAPLKQAKVKIASAAKPLKPSSTIKSASGLAESHITEIFKGTSLAGHNLEEAILEIEQQYGINAYFTIAVMKLESGIGESKIAKKKNNLFGLNALDGDGYNKAFSFNTKADSIRMFGKIISKSYMEKGLTSIENVAQKYCEANSKWPDLVEKIMKNDYEKL